MIKSMPSNLFLSLIFFISILLKGVTFGLTSNSELNLTQEELKWLEEHPVIKFGSNRAWAPVEFVDKKGQLQGISVDYLRTIEKKLGIDFEFIETSTWKEALEKTKRKEIDFLSCVAKTVPREKYLNYTEAYRSTPIMIFTRDDISFIDNMQTLKGKRVCVVAGYAIEDFLRLEYPEIILVRSDYVEEGLKKVIKGEAFAFLDDLVVVTYYVRQFRLTRVKVAGQTPYSYDLRIGVRKDWPMLAGILQKTLNSITEAQRLEIQRKWVPLQYPPIFDYSLLWKILVPLAILVFIIFIYWNQRLRTEIFTRKQIENQLIVAKEQAEVANRTKSLFLANMSHELRTPMNAILGYAQLMRKDPTLQPEQKENLDTINYSGEHLLELINDVLEISKIESGKVTLDNSIFDLQDFFHGLVRMFTSSAEAKGLKFEIIGAEELPRYISTDENKLRRILINLLSNAVKFTETGRIIMRLAAKTEDPDRMRLMIEVEDTGIGVAENELNKIFKYFEQTESGRKSKSGAGLGLAISRDYARMMGGDITFSSKIHKGSIFSLEVLVKKTGESDIRNKVRPRHVIGLGDGQEIPRILVAEDKEESRNLLVKILEMAGFEVKQTVNGKEAIEIFKEWHPDLIWMDVRMPTMNGLEATRHIKRTEAGKSTVIVALTAHTLEEEKRVILAAGCDDFIRKPFREQEIFEVMAKHLGLEYTYENLLENALPGEEVLEIRPEQVTALPKDLLSQLHDAAIELDVNRILSLIEHIKPIDPYMAKALETCANRFALGPLLDLLKKIERSEQGE